MSRLENELDLNFSLMPAIQALIRPPDGDPPRMQTRKHHPYYRRPGRGHNHDCCDACQETGNLICCDRCPSSFHFGCHDPPLNQEDIPAGTWLCHKCKMSKRASIVKSGSVDSQMHAADNSRPSTPTTAEPDTIDGLPVFGPQNNTLPQRIVPKRSNSLLATNRMSVSNEQSAMEKMQNRGVTLLQQPIESLTPMDQLIRAASLMNPTQFDLPREMCIYQQFPGDERIEPTNGNGKRLCRNGGKNGRPHELDGQGLVPLPAKTCFTCHKSCKKAPLVACDYCPLYFHLDCMDPPLTALPVGLWMCPNHAAHFMDWQLLSSMSATERVRIWSKFEMPIDHDTVKAQFLKRVNSDTSRFRCKLKPRHRHQSQIPEMVQYHYANPPSMVPSLKDVLRCEAVEKRLLPRQSWWPRRRPDEPAEPVESLSQDLETDILAINAATRTLDRLANDEETDADEYKDTLGQNGIHLDEEMKETESSSEELEGDILSTLDIKTIKKLALERLQELRNGAQGEDVLELPKDSKNNFNGLGASNPKVSEARSTPMLVPTPTRHDGQVKFITNRPREPLIQDNIQARAALTPISPKLPVSEYSSAKCIKSSHLMRYRKLTIGTAASNDLVLNNYGRCQQTSEKHAIIFYDEATRSFELINYSEHGTEVNGQLFSLDLGDRAPKKKAKPDAQDLREQVLELIDRKRGIQRIKYEDINNDLRMPPPEKAPTSIQCKCSSRAPLLRGWEGSAPLIHGNLIKFGCIAFVFSVVERPDPAER